MKKTIFIFVILLAISAVFNFIPQKGASSTASPNITVCPDSTCAPGATWTCTLYDAATGLPTSLTCTVSPLGSRCCTVDAAGLAPGKYYWELSSGSPVIGNFCIGKTFYYDGKHDYTDHFSCNNCLGQKPKGKK